MLKKKEGRHDDLHELVSPSFTCRETTWTYMCMYIQDSAKSICEQRREHTELTHV